MARRIHPQAYGSKHGYTRSTPFTVRITVTMTRLVKCLAIAGALIVLMPLGLAPIVISYVNASLVPSEIVDFRPEEFPARADTPFFYSIGDDLKYSDRVDVQALTLLHGHISNFLVSPDNKKIAVVADGQLVVVGTKSVLRRVTAVDSIFRMPKPIGQEFWRDDNFQWSSDSSRSTLFEMNTTTPDGHSCSQAKESSGGTTSIRAPSSSW